MNPLLNDTEIRVLGSLVEKEITTPEYYPMSLNALVNACNQKSNREPVVSYDENTVTEALDSLREKELIIVVRNRDSRVVKYDNYFADGYLLSPQEVAVMNVLMLRGPQTLGEIRNRADRMYDFASLEEVEAVLDGLVAREEQPLVVKLPRQTGHKECRYAHLLAGEEAVNNLTISEPAGGTIESERIDMLEQTIESLRRELDELKKQFNDFRNQFE